MTPFTRTMAAVLTSAAFSAAFSAALTTSALAQNFPNKQIHFVVPYGAGATLDNVAPLVGQEISKTLAQPVVVENKTGADGIIGFEYVAKQAPADGYTICIAAVSGLATLPLTVKGLRFDPLKDLPPLVGMVEGKYILTVPNTLPAKNFAEFVALAKASPGKLNYGASSTTVRLQSEALLAALGIDVVYVPYKSGPQYIQAIAAGEIQMGFVAEGSAMSIANRARAIAVTGPQRTSNFPGVPTFDEVKLTSIRGVAYSLNVRAGTPKAAADRLQAAVQQALALPEVKDKLAKMGLDAVAQGPEAAAQRLADEARTFAAVAAKAGVKPE